MLERRRQFRKGRLSIVEVRMAGVLPLEGVEKLLAMLLLCGLQNGVFTGVRRMKLAMRRASWAIWALTLADRNCRTSPAGMSYATPKFF